MCRRLGFIRKECAFAPPRTKGLALVGDAAGVRTPIREWPIRIRVIELAESAENVFTLHAYDWCVVGLLNFFFAAVTSKNRSGAIKAIVGGCWGVHANHNDNRFSSTGLFAGLAFRYGPCAASLLGLLLGVIDARRAILHPIILQGSRDRGPVPVVAPFFFCELHHRRGCL